jgi:hypothetical protein
MKCLSLFIVFYFLFSPNEIFAQDIFLKKKKKTFPFPNKNLSDQSIGVWAKDNTLEYISDPVKGWKLVNASKDSVTVERAIKWRDTIIRRKIGIYPQGFIYGYDFRKDGQKLTKLYCVENSEQKRFAWSDIDVIKYPTYSGNGNGCMGCLLIPGFNIGFIIWASNRWKAYTINMKEWELIID